MRSSRDTCVSCILSATLLSLALLSVAASSAALAGDNTWTVAQTTGHHNDDGTYTIDIYEGDRSAAVTRKNKRQAERDAQTVCDALNAEEGFVDPCAGKEDGCEIPPGLY